MFDGGTALVASCSAVEAVALEREGLAVVLEVAHEALALAPGRARLHPRVLVGREPHAVVPGVRHGPSQPPGTDAWQSGSAGSGCVTVRP